MTSYPSNEVLPVPSLVDRLIKYVLMVCLLVALLPILGSWLSSAPAVLDLAAQFLVQATYLTGLVFLLALLGGQRRLFMAAAVALTVAAVILVPMAWPTEHVAGGTQASGQGSAEPSLPLTVYFHNTWASNMETKATVAAAAASRADVLLFAETTKWRWNLFKPLKAQFPYSISCADRVECDLTLFSRLPIADPLVFHDKASGARAIAATIGGSAGVRVRIVGVHLGRPVPPDDLNLQLQQAQTLQSSGLFATALPLMVIGDFNAVPWGRVVRSFTANQQLRGTGGIVGTWPTFLPAPLRVRIDQALVSPQIQVFKQQIMAGYGSDHAALAVTVSVPP